MNESSFFFLVVVFAQTVTFKSDSVIFGSWQKLGSSCIFKKLVQRGIFTEHVSRKVFIGWITLPCCWVRLSHMWSETDGWTWSHTGSRSALKRRFLWQRACHNTLKLCRAEMLRGDPEGVGRHTRQVIYDYIIIFFLYIYIYIYLPSRCVLRW